MFLGYIWMSFCTLPRLTVFYHRRELAKYYFCRDKHVLSRQNTCFVATKVCLPRQNFCRDKIMFVYKRFCLNKHAFVATKIIFVAAPANDSLPPVASALPVPSPPPPPPPAPRPIPPLPPHPQHPLHHPSAVADHPGNRHTLQLLQEAQQKNTRNKHVGILKKMTVDITERRRLNRRSSSSFLSPFYLPRGRPAKLSKFLPSFLFCFLGLLFFLYSSSSFCCCCCSFLLLFFFFFSFFFF